MEGANARFEHRMASESSSERRRNLEGDQNRARAAMAKMEKNMEKKEAERNKEIEQRHTQSLEKEKKLIKIEESRQKERDAKDASLRRLEDTINKKSQAKELAEMKYQREVNFAKQYGKEDRTSELKKINIERLRIRKFNRGVEQAEKKQRKLEISQKRKYTKEDTAVQMLKDKFAKTIKREEDIGAAQAKWKGKIGGGAEVAIAKMKAYGYEAGLRKPEFKKTHADFKNYQEVLAGASRMSVKAMGMKRPYKKGAKWMGARISSSGKYRSPSEYRRISRIRSMVEPKFHVRSQAAMEGDFFRAEAPFDYKMSSTLLDKKEQFDEMGQPIEHRRDRASELLSFSGMKQVFTTKQQPRPMPEGIVGPPIQPREKYDYGVNNKLTLLPKSRVTLSLFGSGSSNAPVGNGKKIVPKKKSEFRWF